jgi:uncharacterized repeat protein (TIGR03803 family)
MNASPENYDSKGRFRIMKLELASSVCRRLTAFVFALGLLVAATPRAQAQTFSVIHNFTGGSDGGNPLAGFAIDAAGNFYGTTSAGGAYGAGTVFKVTAKGKVIVLYTFTGGTDGANPEAGLFVDATNGNLYGTTNAGGAYGAGTVFGVTAKGKETVLYSFTGKTDGANPQAPLIMNAVGNIYGTTSAGGLNGNGTVFKMGRKAGGWTEKVLYSFGSGTDGTIPVAGVIFDAAGNIYGTTSAGGSYGYGTVFQLKSSKSKWTENILHDFQNASDGAVPYSGLILDQSGNLYGAATEGGTDGGGTVFEMTPSKSSWTFTVLYSLPGWGISGTYRNLLLDASGNIYATTHCDGANNSGTIYELTQSGGTWTYTSLYVFTGGSDGQFSFSNLVFDKLGNLYGTTKQGGADGYGVIFKVKP